MVSGPQYHWSTGFIFLAQPVRISSSVIPGYQDHWGVGKGPRSEDLQSAVRRLEELRQM